jgi:tetratricopeptide (TPR) repeat protein
MRRSIVLVHRIALLSLAVAATLPGSAAAAAPSPLWGPLEPGPHPVGFAVRERLDPARPFRHPLDLDGRRRGVATARPLQIGIWYPAAAPGGVPMRLGDYVALMGGEQDFSLPAEERRRRGEQLYFQFDVVRAATPEQRERLLALPAAAVRDAPPAAGSFPVVLWSLGSPALYHASAEHLASHGYVVAIAPRVPPTLSPVDGSPTREDYDAKSRDMDELIAELAAFPAADVGNLGVTGFSAGGRWALAAAMRNAHVRAVVSQDSILLFGDDGAGQFAGMPFFDPERVRVPVLHMVRREWVPNESDDLWQALRFADRTRIVFENPLDHLDFAGIGYAAALAGLRGEARDAIERAFAAWQNATLWFFDAHLKGDTAARQRVAALPASFGLPAGFVTGERLPPAASGPGEQQLLEALVDDFARAVAVYRRLLAEQGAPPVSERALNLAGYQLLGVGRPEDALTTFTLNTEAFPASANVWDSLADAQAALGRRDEAIASSEKALALLAGQELPADRREAIRRSAEDRLARLRAAGEAPPR